MKWKVSDFFGNREKPSIIDGGTSENKQNNNSAELANNYVEQTRNSIETDILLVILDINNQSALYYENPNLFKPSINIELELFSITCILIFDSLIKTYVLERDKRLLAKSKQL